jgi:predicted nucleotidyltransferase
MVNEEIIGIRDRILACEEGTCEKIILFGSYAYGTPHKDSDYDFYVVLSDDCPDKPIVVLQKIERNLGDTKLVPVDVLGNYKNRFETRSKLPTIERAIAAKGVVLYERA